MQELSFTLSIEGWWLYLSAPRVLQLDLHLGILIGVAFIVIGVKLFNRARNQIRMDNSLALLGAVYPKPGPKEHGPRFYKRRRRGL
jgi:hypothetical protein